MVAAVRRCEARLVRRVALFALVLSSAAVLAPAQAAEQTVTGTVAAQSLGLSLSGAASSPAMTVTTEQRGDTLYITATPAS